MQPQHNLNYELVAKAAEGNEHAIKLIQDNFITYKKILDEGKYSVDEYLNAVMFVSFRMAGDSKQEAYRKVFPERYKRLIESGAEPKKIASFTSAYSKTKLVVGITEQSYIPTWVLNQDKYQAALNAQYELMLTAKSEMVRCKAAECLIQHLKKPDVVDVPLININVNNDGIAKLENALTALAEQQLQAIQTGTPTKTIVEAEIVTEEDS